MDNGTTPRAIRQNEVVLPGNRNRMQRQIDSESSRDNALLGASLSSLS